MIKRNKCNMCGKDMDFFDKQQNFAINVHIGYGSIFDGGKANLNLCCDCFDKLVKKCVIDPIQYGSEDEKPRKNGSGITYTISKK